LSIACGRHGAVYGMSGYPEPLEYVSSPLVFVIFLHLIVRLDFSTG
jgi:hypothetical protein